MNRKEKATKIGKILDELYPKTPVPLDHTSAYTLLVAVMLSAQTTDKKVNQVTPSLFKLANTAEAMAKLEIDTIKNLIKEIGLAPTKAKNLKIMAHQIIKGKGIHPDWDYLESLAGVGHKTAGVVMAQWFNIPAFPIDTHIHRLAARWGLSKAKNVKMTEKDLKALWPKEKWNQKHLQIIFFGREHCPARTHNLSNCPICSWAATKRRIQEENGNLKRN
jgi:endonuclease III